MKKTAPILLAAAVALSACSNLSSNQRFNAGGLAGGAAGLAIADMLDGDDTTKIAGALLGAAAGSSYAANRGY